MYDHKKKKIAFCFHFRGVKTFKNDIEVDSN